MRIPSTAQRSIRVAQQVSVGTRYNHPLPPETPVPKCLAQPSNARNPSCCSSLMAGAIANNPPTMPSPWPRHLTGNACRSEEHTSELQSLLRISYAVFCLNKKKQNTEINN